MVTRRVVLSDELRGQHAPQIRLVEEMKKNKNENEDKDLISKLPTDILYCIVSFVDLKSIVKFSLLSKRWQFLSSQHILPECIPDVVLSFNRFPPFAYGQLSWPDKTTRELLEQNCCEFDESDPLQSSSFIALEKRLLFCRHAATPIRTFSFSCKTECPFGFSCKTECCMDRFKRYLSAALEHCVEEIHLSIGNKLFGKCRSSLNSKTLRVLTVRGDRRVLQKFNPKVGDLPNLQYLHLEEVLFSKGIDSLGNCLQLKTLILKSCYLDCEAFCLTSTSLESLVIENVVEDYSGSCEIIITAPSLKSFRLFDCPLTKYIALSSATPKKVEFDTTIYRYFEPGKDIYPGSKELYARLLIECLRSFEGVQSLTLGGRSVQHLSGAQGLMEQFPMLQNLTSLTLKHWLYERCFRPIVCLLQNAPNVETLVFETIKLICRFKFNTDAYQRRIFEGQDLGHRIQKAGWELDVVSDYKLDRLKTIVIKGFLGLEDEFRLLKFLLTIAAALERIVLDVADSEDRWRGMGKRRERISEAILELPRASSSISISFLNLYIKP